MRNSFFLVLLLSLLLGAPFAATAQEASLTTDIIQGKPVRIRYTSKRHLIPTRTFLLKDRQTGKRAIVNLPLVNVKDGVFESTFVIVYDKTEEDAPQNVENITLDVYPLKSISTKIATASDPRKQNVILLQSDKQEKERIAFELAESKRREELERKAKAFSEQERKNRKVKAQTLANEAMEAYNKKDYAAATEKFKTAIEFDPENNKYYFQYGVSLFQQEEYQQSLVALSMAEDGDYSRIDKNYFIGMNHYRLNNADSALKYLVEVREENDELLSATAAYYAGLLQYSSSRFNEAKASFNYVLDTSKDPRMDDSAESYIDKIDAIQDFQSKFKDKWAYSVYGGVMYDSNILSIAAADAPTDLAGLRAIYGGTLERRMIYDYFKEWSIIGSISDIYSTSTSLQAKEEFQNTDPLVFSLKSPVKWKTTLMNKNYILTLTPGLESIVMNSDGQGGRENAYNSAYLTVGNTFFHSNTWVGNYDLDLRNDNSNIETSAEDDQTAMKMSVGTTQIFVGDSAKGQAYIADLFLINNNAKGDNQKYDRINIGLSYAQNFYWATQAAVRLDLGTATYGSHSSDRKDSNYGLTFSALKPLKNKWSTSLSIGWSDNHSTLDTYSYDKIMISNMYTYTGAF